MLEKFKTRDELHLKRKIFHFCSIFIIFLSMVHLPQWLCWLLYLIIGVPIIFVDWFRRHNSKLNKWTLQILGPVLRKHEARKTMGSTYAALAVGIMVALFPMPIAQISILFLAIGDPIASYFGVLYGKKQLRPGKRLIGTLAAFCFCSFSVFLFFTLSLFPELSLDQRILLALTCGSFGALAELIPVGTLDDNLTQPLLSGSACWTLFLFWGDLI